MLSAGLNPPYEIVNSIELHLTARVENLFTEEDEYILKN